MQATNTGIIEAYEYETGPEPALPSWSGYGETSTLAKPAERPSIAQMEQRIGEESRRSFEAGRQRGLEEGRQIEREDLTTARGAEERRRAEQVAGLLRTFAEESDSYLHAVEQEVVKLALAVASRILRREAQMDPLLLTGAVRVALGQLSKTTQARLRVPESELSFWQEAIEHLPNLAVRPIVVAGEQMRLGDCALETEIGSVDLGIRAQLAEIERGFFDREKHRPAQAHELSAEQELHQEAGA